MTRGGKREGAGRKPASLDGIRIAHQIKFTDTEWKTIQENASKLKLNASEYVRLKVLVD